ncbi:MAG: ATP synthase F1 subunit epsilon [Candidatus Eiseniibacteriota bacterium]|jgi:F-type H+-transporting ATPase subunit epsilon
MPFTLAIQTPTRPVFDGEVESIVAPGSEGYLGVLAHHAPLITGLQAGHLEVRMPDGQTRTYFVSGGFLEVSHNRAIVLADSLEAIEELDAERARGALDEARRERATAATSDVAVAEQRLALARARLRAAKRQRGESY